MVRHISILLQVAELYERYPFEYIKKQLYFIQIGEEIIKYDDLFLQLSRISMFNVNQSGKDH
ncbi:hypothetical protein pb186bvf_001402 [Paramecium bursaria]